MTRPVQSFFPVSYMRETAEAELTMWEADGLPDPQSVWQVLFVHGSGIAEAAAAWVEAKTFRRRLIDAAVSADAENRLRLSLGFPELVATVNVLEYVPDGTERLVALLERKA